MDLLKRENFWIWILLEVITGLSIYVLAALLGVYDKNAWYAKWQNWLLGLLLFVFPIFIMFIVFSIQISIETAKKLNVPGEEIYDSPLVWMALLIVPILGWFIFGLLVFYLTIMVLIQLYKGEGEQYIN